MKKSIVTISVVILLGAIGLLLLYATPRSHVSQQESNPTPHPVTLSVNPASLNFTVPRGANFPSARLLDVNLSSGESSLIRSSISYASGSGWLMTGNSTVHAGTPGSVVVTMNPSGLSAGTYAATISVSESGFTTSVPVTLTVSASAAPSPPSQDTSNWQTFTHTNTISHVQVSFKYPNNWTVGTVKYAPDTFTIQPTALFTAESFTNAIVFSMIEPCGIPPRCFRELSLDEIATRGDAGKGDFRPGTILKKITLSDGTRVIMSKIPTVRPVILSYTKIALS